jgi:hypothetical protein
MNRFTSFAVVAILLAGADSLWAHGLQITIDGTGKLQLVSDDPTAGSNLIYKVQTMFGNATSRSNDHPGYDASAGFSLGDSIYFDSLGPLWYSPGSGGTQHSPVGVNLAITPQDLTIPGGVTVTGSSGFQNGFLIGEYDGLALGAYEHQLNYQIDVPSGIPIGAYAITLQLRGSDAANQPFVPSDALVAVFNVGLPLGSFNTVAGELYTAATGVPEPSSILLATTAACGLAWFARRKRRSR